MGVYKMFSWKIIGFIISFSILCLGSSITQDHPSLRHDKPTPVMIASMGYPVETHTVITSDCYILEMHRIPHGKNSKAATKGSILLVHGVLASSADWVMGMPKKFLGYILADAGYDVWLGNCRGNTYSRNHCSLDPDKDQEFWRFSFDETGEFDLPAMIDKVRETSGQEKIFYVGHSMGTTSFMVMANKKPEYQEYIHMANFLAPIAFVDHMKSPLKYVAPFVNQLDWILTMLGLGEFLPSNIFMDWMASFFCHEGNLQGICSNIIFVLCGFDEPQVNKTLLETIMHHTPAGASTDSFVHFAQEINSKRFSAFDYGNENSDIYGQDTPPEYDLTKVNVPIGLYWGENDWLAHPSDILRLLTKLPNVAHNYEVPYDAWNHLDFIWGIDANIYVYNELLKNLEEDVANLF